MVAAAEQKVKRLRESASWRRPACFVQHRAGHSVQDGEQGQGQGPPARAPRRAQGGHLQCHTGEKSAENWKIHVRFRLWRTSSWCPTLDLVIASSKGSFLMPQRGTNLNAKSLCCLSHNFSTKEFLAIILWTTMVSFVLSSH